MLCLNISIIHAKEPESLMIVAHPDDETIWGGSHLINGNYSDQYKNDQIKNSCPKSSPPRWGYGNEK